MLCAESGGGDGDDSSGAAPRFCLGASTSTHGCVRTSKKKKPPHAHLIVVCGCGVRDMHRSGKNLAGTPLPISKIHNSIDYLDYLPIFTRRPHCLVAASSQAVRGSAAAAGLWCSCWALGGAGGARPAACSSGGLPGTGGRWSAGAAARGRPGRR